jgi:hypothetical protein
MCDPLDEWARWLREDQEREADAEELERNPPDYSDMEDIPGWGIF